MCDTAKELAERLTRGGLEVEAIEEYGAGTKELIVAEVKKPGHSGFVAS